MTPTPNKFPFRSCPTPLPPELPLLDDAAYQRALAILLDVGVTLAQELKTKDAPLATRALAFKQIDEAIRRTIILSRHIAEAAPAKAAQQAQRQAQRTLARRHVIRTVEDTIQRAAKPDDVASLRVELLERIDAPEFIDELDNRPVGELIAELCRDFGLVAAIPGYRAVVRRTPQDIAVLCAQAAAPAGSGLPQWLAATDPMAERNDASPAIRLKKH